MTEEILTFNSDAVANIEIKNREGTWRVLHYDKIANQTRITFVNGMDDPDNLPRSPNKRLTQQQFLRELASQSGIDLI